MKMYILIKDDVPAHFAVVAASHASLACYLKFKEMPEMREWVSGTFFKVVCKVDEIQFNEARGVPYNVVITESALDDREVAIAFRPRDIWPKQFQYFCKWKYERKHHDGDCSIYALVEGGSPEYGICTCGLAHYWKPRMTGKFDEWLKMMYSEQRLNGMELEHQKFLEKEGITEEEYRCRMTEMMTKHFGPPVCASCGKPMADSSETGIGRWTCYSCYPKAKGEEPS